MVKYNTNVIQYTFPHNEGLYQSKSIREKVEFSHNKLIFSEQVQVNKQNNILEVLDSWSVREKVEFSHNKLRFSEQVEKSWTIYWSVPRNPKWRPKWSSFLKNHSCMLEIAHSMMTFSEQLLEYAQNNILKVLDNPLTLPRNPIWRRHYL